jgi:ribulose-5-phosphate 4-epimerase/fuculose-1-phosphate aldolase
MNPTHYYMARVSPPSEVDLQDIVEFDADSQQVSAVAAPVFSERFIHGEIYRKRPDVQAIVHCHPPAVLPFTVTTTPFKAVIHTAYFLGAEAAPVFDLRGAEGEDNRMLVVNRSSGAALASTLGTRSVVLMRGHGMAIAAPSVRDAVFRSIYSIVNAEVEMQALSLGKPIFLNKFEAQRTEWIDPLWEIWRKQADGRQ